MHDMVRIVITNFGSIVDLNPFVTLGLALFSHFTGNDSKVMKLQVQFANLKPLFYIFYGPFGKITRKEDRYERI
jgi:hypothetical protein